MKRGVFFCDIMGTLTNDLNGNDIDENQVESLIRHLEEIRKADNLDEMYFSLISSDHMEDIVKIFDKRIRPSIEKSTIKIGPVFSSSHFKEMGEYEEPSDIKGTKCEAGKPIQMYQAIINELKLKKTFKLDDIKKIYFADDILMYHEIMQRIIDAKIPNLDYQSFVLGDNILKNGIHPDKTCITKEKGINSLNTVLEEYVKTQQNRDIMLKMPKVLLHIHLDGALRTQTVYKRLKENPLKLEDIEKWFEQGDISEADRESLRKIAILGETITIEDVQENLSINKDCMDLNQYLQKFSLPGSVLQTEKEIEESTYELFEDLSKQNVIYAEVRFAPSKHTFKGLSQEKIVEAAIRGMEKAKQEFNIDGNLILCCMRGAGDKNEQANLQTVNVAKKYLNKGVCSIDLAGAEALFKTKEFEKIFKKAKEEGIPFTIHSGEADGPESVRAALDFGASRIGHGVNSIKDKELLERLRKEEIPLEVCILSNLQTQAISGTHPIEELYKAGIKVTLNTDNDTVSSISILEEYKWVLENTNLTIEDLYQMNINAVRGAFISPQNKAKLLETINNRRENIQTGKDIR